ncbi:MAG: pyrroloquinoline quinone-dependent dehydrogenase [Acidimicrobiia bacterium]|nr:pyrroloquinoline quinone-dependent dehydrogenase [Acidimicrobiia bacterium]
MKSFNLLSACLLAIAHFSCSSAPEVVRRGPAADWPHYGNDPGSSRYSPLEEVMPANVEHLEIAWTFQTGDISRGDSEWKGQRVRTRSSFQATPLLIDGTLYLVTPINRVVALDPETGRQRWAFDPVIDRIGDYGDGFACRGLASWLNREAQADAPCRRRLYVATQDARLISVDAARGDVCKDFGTAGEVRLDEGIHIVNKGEYHMTSAPAVVGDVVVVGSAINDNGRIEMPAGRVRGYHVRTGKLLWAWDPIVSDANVQTGAANAWGPLSSDPERDLVFIPTTSPSPDFYGGFRPGNNQFANSVVALRASTGQLAWSFQVVHHDLWDYDVASGPSLFNLKRNGADVPALVLATKMGHLFFLHRETGQPLHPVEERPVPQHPVAGEWLSPTQPFPAATGPLAANKLRPEDAFGITPWDRKACRERIASLRNDGIFTPPSLRGSLNYPGNIGGSNWGGVAVDPARGLVLVNQTNLPFEVKLIPRDQAETDRKQNPGYEYGAQRGTPYVMRRRALTSPLDLPCSPPPWGTLAAVDVHTGKIRWQEPLGTVRDLAPVPLPFKWGTPTMGGPIVTASGLTFISATLDNYLRAFDTTSGKELWKGRLPAGSLATPMTYRVREGGRQFIVIAAGGHAKAPSQQGDFLVAFALP